MSQAFPDEAGSKREQRRAWVREEELRELLILLHDVDETAAQKRNSDGDVEFTLAVVNIDSMTGAYIHLPRPQHR